MKDCEGSGGIGEKEQVVHRVEVDVARVCWRIANGGDITSIRIDNEELMVLACGKELTASAVNSESGGTGAWRKLPRCCDLLCAGVNSSDFAKCRKSHKDITFPIPYGGAGPSTERDRRDYLVGCRVDDGRTVATGVEDEYGFGDWIEHNGIRNQGSGWR